MTDLYRAGAATQVGATLYPASQPAQAGWQSQFAAYDRNFVLSTIRVDSSITSALLDTLPHLKPRRSGSVDQRVSAVVGYAVLMGLTMSERLKGIGMR